MLDHNKELVKSFQSSSQSRIDGLERQLAELKTAMPNDSMVHGILQTLTAMVDSRISAALEKDEADDAKQMETIRSLINESLNRVLIDMAEDRKLMMQILSGMNKPKYRTGTVQLPTGPVTMTIVEN